MKSSQRSVVLVNRETGGRIKLGGYRPSEGKKPAKAQKFAASRFEEDQLPPRVDLRPYMTTVENQSSLSSCVANSLAGAYEYLAKRAKGDATDVSRLFIYYNARAHEGDTLEDAGCMITSAIEVLQEYGACSEMTWDYRENRVNQRPHATAYEEARNFLIEQADELKANLHDMKHCLAEGFPFAFGLRLFYSFDKAAKRGVVPMPEETEEGRAEHGWHAMLCVGYSDASQAFIVRNSWGEAWGDRGYCYIPYEYMTNSDYCQELWAVRAVSDLDFSSGVWVENDFSVIESVLSMFGSLGHEDSDSSIYEYEYEEFDRVLDCSDAEDSDDAEFEETEAVDESEEEEDEEIEDADEGDYDEAEAVDDSEDENEEEEDEESEDEESEGEEEEGDYDAEAVDDSEDEESEDEEEGDYEEESGDEGEDEAEEEGDYEEESVDEGEDEDYGDEEE